MRGSAVVVLLGLACAGGCASILGISEPIETTADADRDGEGEGDAGEVEAGDPGAPTDGGDLTDAGADVRAPRSCQSGGPGTTTCGASAHDCCASSEIAGGTFFRSYDGLGYADAGSPATVQSFRLDDYEVTVGRFRPFVEAVINKKFPAVGAGIHSHLNGGKGLATGSGYETGWQLLWSNPFPAKASMWDDSLTNRCDGGAHATWTPAPASNENRPINCVTWAEAYAFCIWDGGFLPSEAEWNYAAAGGDQQRVYPWSVPATLGSISCQHATFAPDGGQCNPLLGANDVGWTPMGNNRWGQTDLAGNLWEWVLDSYSASYMTPCDDCARLWGSGSENPGTRVIRGGAFNEGAPALLSANRESAEGKLRFAKVGVRCARAP